MNSVKNCAEFEIVQFKNCRLIRNHQLIVDDFWVRNGKIIDPEKVFFDLKIKSHKQIDCDGAIIAAGFIDLQINGKRFRFLFSCILFSHFNTC